MNLRKFGALSTALLMVALLGSPFAAHADAKRKIAIMPFDYGAVSATVGTVDVGKGVEELLINQLVKDGTYRLIDRDMMDKILAEQNFSQSDRADNSSAIKIGKMLSCDALVTGKITQFGVEHNNNSVGVGSALGYIPYAGGIAGSLVGNVGRKSSSAKVSITCHLIDTTTGEIVASATGTAESKKGKWNVHSDWDWSSSDFATSVAGEAVIGAVSQMLPELTAAASKIQNYSGAVAANAKGKVADISGDDITVNIGKKNGIAVGDNLQIERVTKTIKDPNDASKILKEVTATVAVITVKDADDSTATGTVTKGSGLRVGDLVRKVTTDVSAVVLTPIGGTGAPTVKPKAK